MVRVAAAPHLEAPEITTSEPGTHPQDKIESGAWYVVDANPDDPLTPPSVTSCPPSSPANPAPPPGTPTTPPTLNRESD